MTVQPPEKIVDLKPEELVSEQPKRYDKRNSHMSRLGLAIFLLGALVSSDAALARGGSGFGGSHATSGYVRSNGTYVRPSGATNPNRTQFDNFSTRGNVNPYSGAVGTKTPKY